MTLEAIWTASTLILLIMGDDITPDRDGGILKKVTTPGPNPDDKPWKGDKVWVHYTGTLENGTKFDSRYNQSTLLRKCCATADKKFQCLHSFYFSLDRGDKFQFSLGKAEVIKGWDIGVASMCLGEVAVFTIRSDYAYGASGKQPQIPPNATLIFEVELCECKYFIVAAFSRAL